EDILSFFASDLMIDKIRQLVAELKSLNDVSKAENLENLLKKMQEDAQRILRDKTELYVDGQNIIALGKHKFSVNNQSLSLTLVNRNNELFYHLTGTSFYQKVQNTDLADYKDIWNQELLSENNTVYRAEYLAFKAFKATTYSDFDGSAFINQTVEQNYSEGYIKGVHNTDALAIYEALQSIDKKLGVLRYNVSTRSVAQLFWHHLPENDQQKLFTLIQSTHSVLKAFPSTQRYQSVIDQIENDFEKWHTTVDQTLTDKTSVAHYIFGSFSNYKKFAISEFSDHLKQEFLRIVQEKRSLADFQADVQNEQFSLTDRYFLILNWLNAFIDEHTDLEIYRKYIDETAVVLLFSKDEYQLVFGKDSVEITELKGNHSILEDGSFTLDYYDFISKLTDFTNNKVPRFEAFIN